MINTPRRINTKSKIHLIPNKLSYMTIEKQMLDSSIMTTETTFFLSPFHFLLAKLSFVRITPFLRYHKKILIFSGTLNFQEMFLSEEKLFNIISLYIDKAGLFCLPSRQTDPLYSPNPPALFPKPA